GRAPRRDERPVILPRRALLDPAAQQFELPRCELAAGVRQRHALRRIGRRDAAPEMTVRELAGHDGAVLAEIAEEAALGVEAQVGLARGLGRAVAGVARVRQDRPDVAVKLD